MNNHPIWAPFARDSARPLSLAVVQALPQLHRSWLGRIPCRVIDFQFDRSPFYIKIVSVLVLITLVFSGLLPASRLFAANNTSPSISVDAQVVVDRINQIRTSNGLAYLSLNPHLVQAAQSHVVDMVTNSHHSHTGTDGSSVRMRIERSGYGSGKRSGENWVALTDPTKAVEWWMASPPHRANILNVAWQEIGIGSGINVNSGLNYFVVVFAASDGDFTTPALNNTSSPPPLSVSAALPQYHHVQLGETLSSIGLKYGLPWQSVAKANNLTEFSILSIGQSIRLTSDDVWGDTDNIAEIHSLSYTVVPGDTLFTLGSRFNVPWQDIAQHNGLNENSILSIEQVLNIPIIAGTVNEAFLEERSFAPPRITPDFHVVQDGETIIIIALQYDLNWKQLLQLNSLTDSSLLNVGQQIRLK